MLELAAQVGVAAFELLLVAWVLPHLITRTPPLPRWLRRAYNGVKYALAWPGRSSLPPRPSGPALRIERNGRDSRSRELMLGTGMEITALHPEHDEVLVRRDGCGVQVVHTAGLPDGFEPGIRAPEPQPSMEALVQLAAGRPPTAAGPSRWAPAVIAAMPTARCNSCPVWGCAAQGDNPECAVVRPSEERLSASLPCPFCGRKPVRQDDGTWLAVHQKRCVLRKRRKLRDRVKDSIEATAAEQLAKDIRQLGTQSRAELDRLAESLRRGERGKGRQCGACDQLVRYSEDEPASIGHAVGCPRRSWPVERAALPRPGKGQAPAPNRGPGPHVVEPCPSCDRPARAPAGDCRSHRRPPPTSRGAASEPNRGSPRDR